MPGILKDFQAMTKKAKEIGIEVTVSSDDSIYLSTKNRSFGCFPCVRDAIIFMQGVEHGMWLANHPEDLIRD